MIYPGSPSEFIREVRLEFKPLDNQSHSPDKGHFRVRSGWDFSILCLYSRSSRHHSYMLLSSISERGSLGPSQVFSDSHASGPLLCSNLSAFAFTQSPSKWKLIPRGNQCPSQPEPCYQGNHSRQWLRAHWDAAAEPKACIRATAIRVGSFWQLWSVLYEVEHGNYVFVAFIMSQFNCHGFIVVFKIFIFLPGLLSKRWKLVP